MLCPLLLKVLVKNFSNLNGDERAEDHHQGMGIDKN
jgi:hypothetical protein